MRIALILAHPSAVSFCATLADDCAEVLRAAGGEVVVRDLYRMGFDPCLSAAELPGSVGHGPRADVVAERAILADVDSYLLVYPLWFNAPPAMLKGYVDRVLSGGFGFAPTAHGADPLLVGKTLVSVTTSGAPDAHLAATGALNMLTRAFDLHLCGMTGLRFVDHQHIGGVGPDMTETYAQERRGQVRAMLARELLGHEGD